MQWWHLLNDVTSNLSPECVHCRGNEHRTLTKWLFNVNVDNVRKFNGGVTWILFGRLSKLSINLPRSSLVDDPRSQGRECLLQCLTVCQENRNHAVSTFTFAALSFHSISLGSVYDELLIGLIEAAFLKIRNTACILQAPLRSYEIYFENLLIPTIILHLATLQPLVFHGRQSRGSALIRTHSTTSHSQVDTQMHAQLGKDCSLHAATVTIHNKHLLSQ